MDFRDKLRDYAELIVVHGLNVQAGQVVNVSGEVAHRELVRLIQEWSYQKGAKYVEVELTDGLTARTRIDRSDPSNLSYNPPYLQQKYDYFVKERVANVKLVGPEFPEAMIGADPQRTNTVRKALYEARKKFYEDGIDKSMVHWTVAAAATEGWAKRIFPSFTPSEAYEALWEDIFSFCRIGTGDHLKLWEEHDNALQSQARHLSDLGIHSLRFESHETNLTVGLSEYAVFQGGRSKSNREVLFEPNIPTEECFTTPDWRRCHGKVVATRPFFVNGELIEGLCFELQDGEISDFSAKKGEKMFGEYIASDAGAKRLGEVALVPISSPIFQSGRVFEEILLDENAACHVAIGSGYKFCVQLPDDSTEAYWSEVGCNASSVHTDIMISDESMKVVAELKNGQSIALMEGGQWTNSRKLD